jgi:hypothetical protein
LLRKNTYVQRQGISLWGQKDVLFSILKHLIYSLYFGGANISVVGGWGCDAAASAGETSGCRA